MNTLTVISKTHGRFDVLIDAEDWERVSQHTWGVTRSKTGNVYFQTRVKSPSGKWATMHLHRFLMGNPEGMDVDHKSHVYTDCRKSELRVCTPTENKRNARKRRNNTSGYKGVDFHKASVKYRSRINLNGKLKHLGYRDCPAEAARLYDVAALEHFGEFACLNFQVAA